MTDRPTATRTPPAKDLTGIPGLDEVLAGGLTSGRLYLIEGAPGAGKTTLALQYLLEGARLGQSVLYVALSESEEELKEIAASHGWSLDGLHVRQLIASEASLRPDEQYTMFHPSEVELGETTRDILADVERIKPTRAVFDSMSELRLLSGNPLRYRRQIMALKQFFAGRHATVVLLDDLTTEGHDLQMETIAHAVVRLEQLNPEYGAERRRLRIVKYRGVAYRGGYHDYVIRTGGLEVFPRLRAKDHSTKRLHRQMKSGIAELDSLLGGGISYGTSTLLIGAAGTGKSSIAAQYAATNGARGERSALFLFDESEATLLARSSALGIDLERHVASGLVSMHNVDPAELSPGELASRIRAAVDDFGATLIVIDSLNGYLNALPEERFLIIQLHELLTYLGDAGVATILIGAHQGLIGSHMVAPVEASYLADAVVLMRYFEANGEVRQALSVMKNRAGAHERTIREFKLRTGAIAVGPALHGFRGVLTGVPILDGGEAMMKDDPKS